MSVNFDGTGKDSKAIDPAPKYTNGSPEKQDFQDSPFGKAQIEILKPIYPKK